MMNAMVLSACAPISTRPLVLKNLPTPIPGTGEVLVKVRACGLCRTDLHVIEGELPNPSLPLIPGHQIVGTVEECGPQCSHFKPGDRVGIAWLRYTCRNCEYCRAGNENLCPYSRYTGYHVNGGYAEYAVVSEAWAYEIPDVFSDVEAAPLLCAGIIGYRTLLRSNLPKGGSLAIFGFGSSAHITVQIAKSWGASVYVSTRGAKHQGFAKNFGAAWVGDTFDLPPVAVDSAIVFAPAGEIVPAALRAVKKGGTVALAGIHMSDIPAMSYEAHLFHEKNLRSVEANTRADGEALLKEAAKIHLRPETTLFPLGEANEALRRLKDGEINGTAVLNIS